MDIHHAVDTFIVVLKLDVVLNSPKIVSDMLPARRPGSGKDTPLHFTLLPCRESLAQNEDRGQAGCESCQRKPLAMKQILVYVESESVDAFDLPELQFGLE